MIKRVSREAWIALGLFSLLAAVTAASAVYKARQEKQAALSSYSYAADGARGLRLWLQEMGYATLDEVKEVYRPAQRSELALVLEPLLAFEEQELKALDRWVEKGGTLVLAGERSSARQAMAHFGFEVVLMRDEAQELEAQFPWSAPPNPPGKVVGKTAAYFEAKRGDFVTYLAVQGKPALVSFRQGRGQVFLCVTSYPFTNAGLKDGGNARLALNLLAGLRKTPQTKRFSVWFDEWHHGRHALEQQAAGPWQWLWQTPAGNALLYAGALVFVTLALQGQRFGRPTPLPREVSRRYPLENVSALANLSRRAGRRDEALGAYRAHLKRELGRRYRLDPALPDAEWAAHLAALRPGVDAAALADLLARLSQPRVSEQEMVALASEAARWMETG